MHGRPTLTSITPPRPDGPRRTQLRVTMLPENRRTSLTPRARRISRASFVPRAPRRGKARRLAAPLVAALLMTATFATAPSLLADSPPVVVGEVSTSVGHEEVVPVMRAALATHLANVKIPAGKKLVVSASLTKLESKTEGSATTTTCVVSLALRDAKSGALQGVVQGNASIAGVATTKENESLVSAAIHGAAKGVPDVIAH